METFKVEVEELLSRTIDVQANDIKEAIAIVEQMYRDEEVVLDYTDLTRQDIVSHDLINEKESLIKEVIEYRYADEEKHFAELEEPEDHIFLKLKRLKDMIN